MTNGQLILPAAVAALLCGGTAAFAEDGLLGLWGSKTLIADPKVEAGDIVTIVISPARETPEAGEGDPQPPAPAKEAGRHPAQTMAARVVKRLPNGNLVLEAKVRVGRGYILIGGETARRYLRRGGGTGRTVNISRVAKLAVVARGLDADTLSAFMRSLTRLGRGTGEFRFASGGPAKRQP